MDTKWEELFIKLTVTIMATSKSIRALNFFNKQAKLMNEISMMNSIRLLAMARAEETYNGKLIRHKDGSITITHAKELKQLFKLN